MAGGRFLLLQGILFLLYDLISLISYKHSEAEED
jgi:hypothetical protein